jgi:hypothetical protein
VGGASDEVIVPRLVSVGSLDDGVEALLGMGVVCDAANVICRQL